MKPDNIFLTSAGIAKVGDYGLSRQLNHTFSVRRCAGTPLYVSPEAYTDNLGMPGDCWSLGIILIELAERKNPHKDCSPKMLMKEVCYGQPPSLSHPRWSQEFVEFVNKCLIKDAKERWTTSQLMEVSLILRNKD